MHITGTYILIPWPHIIKWLTTLIQECKLFAVGVFKRSVCQRAACATGLALWVVVPLPRTRWQWQSLSQLLLQIYDVSENIKKQTVSFYYYKTEYFREMLELYFFSRICNWKNISVMNFGRVAPYDIKNFYLL